MVSLGGRAAGRQTGYDGERSAADLRWRTVRQSSDVRSAEKRATKHCSHWIGGKTWGGEGSPPGDIYKPPARQVTRAGGVPPAGQGRGPVQAAARAPAPPPGSPPTH